MKFVATTLLGLVMMAAAYFFTFGLPPSLAALMIAGEEQASEEAAPQVGGPGGRGGSTTVVLEPLALAPYEDVLRAIGSGVALRSVDVTSSVSGAVVEVAILPNTEVAAGDVLLRLDARIETLNLQIAEAELGQARQTHERYETLRTNGNLTISEVDMADAELAAQLAEANVGLAEAALGDRTIRAPINGRVGLSTVETGDRIGTDDVIVTLVDTTTLIVEFELPERSIGLLEPDREVLLSTPVYTGRVFTGEVAAFDSRLDEVTRSVTVRASVDNADGALWSGMTFAIRILDTTAPLPAVPATAVTWTRDGAEIWTAAEGTAARVPITILYRSGDRVWITAEVAEGVPVIVEGAQWVREGGTVQDADAPARADDGPQGGARGQGGDVSEAGAAAAAEDPA